MRIVRLIGSFPRGDVGGGICVNAWYLSREQVRLGYEVTLLSFSEDGSEHSEVREGVALYWVPRPRLVRWFGGISFARAIKRLDLRPDVVHGFNAIPFGWLVWFVRRTLPGVRLTMSIHNTLYPFRRQKMQRLRERFQVFEFQLLMRFLARRMDVVMPVSPFIADELAELGVSRDKMHIVQSGWSKDVFYPATESQNSGRLFTVVCNARFVSKKNVPVLLDAVEQLVRAGRDVHLELVGGSEQDPVAQDVLPRVSSDVLRDVVTHHGVVSLSELSEIVRHADLLVLPSSHDERPKSVIEAMASGVPVVATRVGGLPELIEDGVSGLLVPPNDPAAFADAIIRVMDDAALRHQLLQGGLEAVASLEWGVLAKDCVAALAPK